MRRSAFAFGVLLLTATATRPSHAADAPASSAPVSVPAPAPPPAPPAPAPYGIAVLAAPGATDAAWPLAIAVYNNPALRPPTLDEAHARALCGEPPPPDAPVAVKDLAATAAAVHGDDAPSRALLIDVAHRIGVRGVLVVRVEGARPTARLFLADAGAFDAAVYMPDEGSDRAWTGATLSLARGFGVAQGAPPPPGAAPPLATHDAVILTTAPPKPKAFYEKGWFWGALGAAAFAGGAIFFATRDNGPTSIHLTVQVPH